MLWVIQRDFLEGANASDVVKQALAPVPNPSMNAEVQQVSQREGCVDTLLARVLKLLSLRVLNCCSCSAPRQHGRVLSAFKS